MGGGRRGKVSVRGRREEGEYQSERDWEVEVRVKGRRRRKEREEGECLVTSPESSQGHM